MLSFCDVPSVSKQTISGSAIPQLNRSGEPFLTKPSLTKASIRAMKQYKVVSGDCCRLHVCNKVPVLFSKFPVEDIKLPP